jgi:hypothetical protein
MMPVSGSREEARVKHPSKVEQNAEHLALLALGSLLLGFCAVVLESKLAAGNTALHIGNMTHLFL